MELRKNPTLAKTVTAILIFSLVLVGVPAVPVAASNGGDLAVDVWTDKGGEGKNAAAGTYRVGEETYIYFAVTIMCHTRWTLSGPSAADSAEQELDPDNIYELYLGQAGEGSIGEWQVTFEAWTNTQHAYDTTSFTVVGSEAQSIPTPTPEPAPPPSPSETEGEVTRKVDANNASELLALMTLKMTEGLLPADPNMDANGDGQVTTEDVRLILEWAVKGESGLPSHPQEEEEGTELGPGSTDRDALLGKWKMTRLSIQPEVPVPDLVLNWLIDKKATWEITSDGGQLKIEYGGRDTWYKKTFLKGITEGPTTVRESSDGLSCVFENQGSFYVESLPLLVRFLVPRKVEQLKGTFTGTVSVSVSGNSMAATITVDSVDGTYYGEGEDGQMRQKPINVDSYKVTYQGVKKE